MYIVGSDANAFFPSDNIVVKITTASGESVEVAGAYVAGDSEGSRMPRIEFIASALPGLPVDNLSAADADTDGAQDGATDEKGDGTEEDGNEMVLQMVSCFVVALFPPSLLLFPSLSKPSASMPILLPGQNQT